MLDDLIDWGEIRAHFREKAEAAYRRGRVEQHAADVAALRAEADRVGAIDDDYANGHYLAADYLAAHPPATSDDRLSGTATGGQ